ncbi:MAG: hypothetical protein LBG08_05350 [Spirochaetaceae bacterium]|nr:hypothetical protein [Spirochaetaceae bacterium]
MYDQSAAGSGNRWEESHWAVLDHAPASVDEFTNSDFDTASPFTLKFDESRR